MKGFGQIAVCNGAAKNQRDFTIPNASSHMAICVCVSVCMCGCCGLSAAAAAALWGVRLVVPHGRHLTMGRKTPTIREYPLSTPPSPPLPGNAFKQQFNSSFACLLLFVEAFAFAFCLCSSMCGEFLPPSSIYGNCAIFFNAIGGVFSLFFLLFFVVIPTSVWPDRL